MPTPGGLLGIGGARIPGGAAVQTARELVWSVVGTSLHGGRAMGEIARLASRETGGSLTAGLAGDMSPRWPLCSGDLRNEDGINCADAAVVAGLHAEDDIPVEGRFAVSLL